MLWPKQTECYGKNKPNVMAKTNRILWPKQTECYGQNKPNVMAKTNINLANVSDIFKSDRGKKISVQPAI